MTYSILGKEVGNIGYGLMRLSWHGITQSTEEEKLTLMKAALEAGANAWNGGEFYGDSLQNNSLTLLKKYFDKYPEDANKVSINIKGGVHFPQVNDNDPNFVRQSVQNCITSIGDRVKIDMFEMARRTSQADYLESLRVIDSFAKEGKIGGVALSEVNANTIRQAVKIVKVAAVEVEISLWETGALTNGVCEACAEFGIPIFAYSPVARGILSGKYKRSDSLPGVAAMLPRNQGENFDANLKLVEKVEEWATKKNCTPAQFAINWVAALSRRPGMPKIIPIPGAGSLDHVKQNIHEVNLTDEDMDEVDAFLKEFSVTGERFPEPFKKMLDTTDTTEI